MGLMKHESGYDIDNISPTNDYGLMQINKCNHKWLSKHLGIDDFLNPYQNVLAGTYMLHDLFTRYEDTSLVLMAYNMGEDTAKRLWNNGITETGYTNVVYKAINELEVKKDE